MVSKFVAVTFILIGLCVSAQAETLSNVQKSAIREAIGDKLTDPYSAHYTFDIVKGASTGVITVCGTVNAKNKMGGYVGKSPYAATLLRDKVVMSEIFDGVTLDYMRNQPLCGH